MNNNMNCNYSRCNRTNMNIAMAYVPWQEFRNLDNFKCGYIAGTISRILINLLWEAGVQNELFK